jgi:hypothetical protein
MLRRAERRGLLFDALYSELCESERSRRLAFCFRGDVCTGSRVCENSARYNRTQNFEAWGHAQSKKMQKFVLRSALRPNRISFSHSLGQKETKKHVRCHGTFRRKRPWRPPCLRVRPAHRDEKFTEPRPEEWLLIEWPEREKGRPNTGSRPCRKTSSLRRLLMLPNCAGASNATIKNSSRRSGSDISKVADGAASTTTRRRASRLTAFAAEKFVTQ